MPRTSSWLTAHPHRRFCSTSTMIHLQLFHLLLAYHKTEPLLYGFFDRTGVCLKRFLEVKSSFVSNCALYIRLRPGLITIILNGPYWRHWHLFLIRVFSYDPELQNKTTIYGHVEDTPEIIFHAKKLSTPLISDMKSLNKWWANIRSRKKFESSFFWDAIESDLLKQNR
jgi:hypothetical protein